MNDLISRQAAIDAVDKIFDSIPIGLTTEILQLRRDLRNLPSAQLERKRGRWIKLFEDENAVKARCSECRMVYTLGKGRDPNYCGTCGAKMNEVEE